MSAQVDHVAGSARSLADMAGVLQQVVGQFRLGEGRMKVAVSELP